MRAKDFTPVKNRWELLVTDADKHEWADNLIDLVSTAYKHTNLGSFVNSLSDVERSDWLVLDWDKDDDKDCAIFYRAARPGETWSGHKIQGIGHDGQRESKVRALQRVKNLLTRKGWWIESSDAMAQTLGHLGLPPVVDQHILKRLFPNSNLIMIDSHGKYQRLAGYNNTIREVVYGHPVLKG
jgi:hypothetical protein